VAAGIVPRLDDAETTSGPKPDAAPFDAPQATIEETFTKNPIRETVAASDARRPVRPPRRPGVETARERTRKRAARRLPEDRHDAYLA
jgi:hypothetical protein